MRICFLGTSHAAQHLATAAQEKGFHVVPFGSAHALVFVSEDTPTDRYGKRDLVPIWRLVAQALTSNAQVVLTSQVPPGFTRSIGVQRIYHQAETLRMRDAEERARNPEMIIVGCFDKEVPLTGAYRDYCAAFKCPKIRVSWEDAEFSKIAINMTLAMQVENTNRLAAAAAKCGADWEAVSTCMMFDSRIGPHAYLTPGCWEDSPHLLRDAVTLAEIEGR